MNTKHDAFSRDRLGRFIRLTFSLGPALLLVLISRLLRPFLTMRFGSLKSDRIGHFVLETELMLHEQDLGIHPRPNRSLDVYYAPRPVSNTQVEKMWSRVIRVWPRWLMVTVFRINRIVPGAKHHEVPPTSSTALDVHCLLDVTRPKMWFSDEEESRGKDLLERIGVGGNPFVCVIARDSSYYKKVLPGSDLSYHDYRNCDIDTYVPGMEALADKGLYVLRMGAVVEKPLQTANPRIIDYANSGFRSDFADIYLGANCKFCVSDGLGFFAIPAAFRRPNAYVNYAPFHMFYSSRACDLGIAKVFADAMTGEVIPLRKLVGRDISRLTRSELIDKASLKVLANTPDEISELMIEMNDRLDGVWESHIEADQLQKDFWGIFSRVIGSEGMKMHGEFRARFGEMYLKKHRDWFAD
jgi:putative glycosyltransferase (TIGR04372 family)